MDSLWTAYGQPVDSHITDYRSSIQDRSHHIGFESNSSINWIDFICCWCRHCLRIILPAIFLKMSVQLHRISSNASTVQRSRVFETPIRETERSYFPRKKKGEGLLPSLAERIPIHSVERRKMQGCVRRRGSRLNATAPGLMTGWLSGALHRYTIARKILDSGGW